jgi:hypothetical protein
VSETDHGYQCTLTKPAAARRIDADRALVGRVVATERTSDGVRVSFHADGEARRLVDTFVANESCCCAFFEFAITETEQSVILEIAAPADPSAQEMVDGAKDLFDRDPDAIKLDHRFHASDG